MVDAPNAPINPEKGLKVINHPRVFTPRFSVLLKPVHDSEIFCTKK